MLLSRSHSDRIAIAGLMKKRANKTGGAIVFLAIVPFSVNASAQTGNWTTPVSGYVYDSINRSIRPVAGSIGAALLGPSVAGGIDSLSVAPNQKSALAESNGLTVWIPDLSAAEAFQSLDRVPLAQQTFWAADANQAAILKSRAQIVWLTNLSSRPVPLSSWNLESYNPTVSTSLTSADARRIGSRRQQTVWSLLAADSSANQVLLVSRTGENWQIWLTSSTVPPMNIPFSGHPVAAAFAPGSSGVYVADALNHQIVQIQNLEATPVFTTVVFSDVYVKDPSALVMSSDGNRLFVADRADCVIRVFDVSARSSGSAASVSPIAELPSGAVPASLTSFAPDRFLMNAGDVGRQFVNEPFYFLTTNVPATISFVPRGQ